MRFDALRLLNDREWMLKGTVVEEDQGLPASA